MSILLGVDVGTTSIKCVLFDEEGRVISSGASEYELSMPKPGWVEAPAETYWRAFKESLAKVLNESRKEGRKILGIGVSSQGETFVALDKNGEPLCKAIVWLDNRSEEEARQIKEEFGMDKIYRVTGQSEVIPMWTATKILWLGKNEPEIFRRTRKYTLLEDYMIYKLTGSFTTEYSDVSSSLLFDISKRKWWDEILQFLNISKDQLSELKPSGEAVANVTAEAAKETGLSTGCIVSTGAYDQAANAIGAGNIDSGVISETTGSALAVIATVDHPILDPMRRLPCIHHAVPGKYFLQPCGHTAGSILRWFRNNFGNLETEAANRMNVDPYDVLTLEAAKVPPGSDGLIMLPHFMGAASPEFNPNAKGVLFGLTLYHKRGHIIRAIMESIAYMLRRNIELLEDLGIKVKEVRSTGGTARSPLWNQIKADVLNRSILTVNTEETASLGVAMLAGIAVGVFKYLKEASESTNFVKAKYTPSEANQVYNERYETYIQLYKKIYGN